MEENLLEDLKRIESVICDTDTIEAKGLQRELVAKYRGEISHIEKDLDKGFFDINGLGNDRDPDYMRNLVTIKGKLRVLLAKIKDEEKKSRVQPSSPLISNTTYNNSSSDNHANNTLSNTNNC